jgi:hypothetical protein
VATEEEFNLETYTYDIKELIILSNKLTQMMRDENNKDFVIRMLHMELKSIIGLFESVLDYGYHPKQDQILKELVKDYKLRYIDNNPFGKEK